MSILNSRFIHSTAYVTPLLGNLPGISDSAGTQDSCLYTHTHTHPTLSPLFLVNGTTIYSAGQARNLGVNLDVPHSLIPQPNIHHLMVLNISWFCLPLSILRGQARSSPVLNYSTNLLTEHHQQLPPPSNPFSRQPPK